MGKLPYEKIKRKILIRKDSIGAIGVGPGERPIEEVINYGIVNIDKPRGPTSHQISDYVKKILKIKKAGHSGTLDPNVTGVLPVALGRATRIVQALLPVGKEYVSLMYLHKEVEEKKLLATMNSFVGAIKQRPPLKSAVRRIERIRKVYYIDILETEGKYVLFRIGCQAGTYIRTLCHQIGQRLGTGAHMVELRRTKVGNFNESTAVKLQDLVDAYYYYKNEENEKYLRKIIQPVEVGVAHLPKIWVLDSSVLPLSNGRDLAVPGVSKLETGIKQGDTVALMTLKNELIGLGTAIKNSEEIIENVKGICVRTNKVFIHL